MHGLLFRLNFQSGSTRQAVCLKREEDEDEDEEDEEEEEEDEEDEEDEEEEEEEERRPVARTVDATPTNNKMSTAIML
ncbi:hypothetical protein V1477_005994 [Vespula maculifrons]|uniref:Uncharacterized protein n=1 Tax=Vespula maculifrons TaxID=7453 RepID=A0ABD2CM74_VESMC